MENPPIARRFRPRLPQTVSLFRAKPQPAPLRFAVGNKNRGNPDDHVEWGLRVASAWSIRFLTVAAALVVLGYLVLKLSVIIIPLLVACLLTVLMEPVTRWLRMRLMLPRTLAALLTVLGLVVIVLGLITVASTQILNEAPVLASKAQTGISRLLDWLRDGPFGISNQQINAFLENFESQAARFLRTHSSTLASGALSGLSSVGSVLAGGLIALFLVFFFLKEGHQIWYWVVRLLPSEARVSMHEAGIRGWVTMGSYARTQILVAFVDAVGIAIGAFLLDVPMWLPVGILVFIGSFIPMIGAIFTGAIAILVALVDQGPTTAILMFLVVIGVQQLEGNVLQPWLMGNAVSLHPVAVLLSVAGGTYLAGIVGALFVVPIVAFINTTMLYLNGYDKFPQLRTAVDRPGGPPGALEEFLEGNHHSEDEEDNTLPEAAEAPASNQAE